MASTLQQRQRVWKAQAVTQFVISLTCCRLKAGPMVSSSSPVTSLCVNVYLRGRKSSTDLTLMSFALSSNLRVSLDGSKSPGLNSLETFRTQAWLQEKHQIIRY